MSDPTPSASLPPTTPNSPRPRNRVALIALIIAAVAFVLGVIPFVGFFSWLVAAAAIVVAIVALTRPRLPKSMAVAALVIGVIALIVGPVVAFSSVAGVIAAAGTATNLPSSIDEDDSSVAPSADAPSAAASASSESSSRTVKYTVTGKGKSTTISYFTVNGGKTGQSQANGEKLPWSKTVKLKDDGFLEGSVFSLTAQADSGTSKISCKIEADGKVISEETSTGDYAVVSCSGSPE